MTLTLAFDHNLLKVMLLAVVSQHTRYEATAFIRSRYIAKVMKIERHLHWPPQAGIPIIINIMDMVASYDGHNV